MISNVETYLAIAQEAHAEMKRLDDESRHPKPDGSPGFIVTYDPEGRSLKHAMIAIAFAGMYFEAAVYVLARQKLGKAKAGEVDCMLYEHRLPALGLIDQSLIDGAKVLREARKDLVHEKAITPDELKIATFRFAQKSADQALAFIRQLHGVLTGAP